MEERRRKIMFRMLTTAIIHNKEKRACYRLNVCTPPPPKNSYVETIPSMMILGVGALGSG